MNKIYSIAAIGMILWGYTLSGVHQYSVPKIEGGNQALSDFQGKKILILTLPLEQNPSSDSMLYCLDTLASANITTLKVIAVPSFEDGYAVSQRTQLEIWYRSKLGSYIIITDGLYTRKTSGTQQHPLFLWMTDPTKNEIFNIDVEGPGYKFFAGADGQLYGVLRPHSKISGASVQKTLRLQ